MITEIYNDYKSMGLVAIPIQWDNEKQQPISHRNWQDNDEFALHEQHNALMIRTGNGFGALDFDLKNTKDKAIFDKWMAIITNDRPEILSKVFIEKTRNNGFHVWMNYDKLPKKTPLADSSDGAEVIALYSNGPLVYTFPTFGYSEFHQSMVDIESLSDDEFNYLIEVSQFFNEYKPTYDPTKIAVNYPPGFEQHLIDYDANISDDAFESLLDIIGLEPIKQFKYNQRDKFTAYRRRGSISDGISAKVYFKSKRVLLFTASMHSFPNWHNKEQYPVWSLTPSFILFYHLGREWQNVLDYIGIKRHDSNFPYDIFPGEIRSSIFDVASQRSMSPEFLATAGLWTISSLAGTAYQSTIGGAKNILYCFLVAPMSVGKSPAHEVMCQNPLKIIMESADAEYDKDVRAWEKKRAKAIVDKQPFIEPKPKRHIPFVKDGTIEGYISLCMDQRTGIGIYIDEAEDVMNSGAFKQNNNTISFLTQAFNGGRFVQSRANRDNERVVKNMNINLLMGTQTERIHNIFPMDRIASGFASRFIMVESDYKVLNEESDPFSRSREICPEWVELIRLVYDKGKQHNESDFEPLKIDITAEAMSLYRKYYKSQLRAANERINDRVEGYILGTHAKMSNYMARLTQVVAIMNNPVAPVIDERIVELSHKLYEFYTGETLRIIGRLHSTAETGLPTPLENLFNALPDEFTRKEAVEVCKRINLPERKFDSAMRTKDFSSLFSKIAAGKYRKNV